MELIKQLVAQPREVMTPEPKAKSNDEGPKKRLAVLVGVSLVLTTAVCLTIERLSPANTPLNTGEMGLILIIVAGFVFVLSRLFQRSARKMKSILLVPFMVCVLVGCSKSDDAGDQTEYKGSGSGLHINAPQTQVAVNLVHRIQGRSFLVKGTTEGYGLYSYLLFRYKPDQKEKDQLASYATAIQSYLQVSPVGDEQGKALDAQLNVTYLPINEAPKDPDVTAESLVPLYDYETAKSIWNTCQLGDDCDIALVSAVRPLSQVGSVQSIPYTFFKIATKDDRFIRAWIEAYVSETSKPNFWEHDFTKEEMIKFRQQLARAAQIFGVTVDEAAKLAEKLEKLVGLGGK